MDSTAFQGHRLIPRKEWFANRNFFSRFIRIWFSSRPLSLEDGYMWGESHFRPQNRGIPLTDVTSAQRGDWGNLEFLAMVNQAKTRKEDPHFVDRAYLCLVVAAKRSLDGDHRTAQEAAGRASYRLSLLAAEMPERSHYIFACILELTVQIRAHEALGEEYNPPELPSAFRRLYIQRVVIDEDHIVANLELIARAIQSPRERWLIYGRFEDHVFPALEPETQT